MADSQALQDFVSRLIEEKNYGELEPEVAEQVRKDVMERLVNTINAKSIAALSDEQVAEFEKLLDANASEEEVQAFIAKSIPNGDEFLTRVMTDFRMSYLGMN